MNLEQTQQSKKVYKRLPIIYTADTYYNIYCDSKRTCTVLTSVLIFNSTKPTESPAPQLER